MPPPLLGGATPRFMLRSPRLPRTALPPGADPPGPPAGGCTIHLRAPAGAGSSASPRNDPNPDTRSSVWAHGGHSSPSSKEGGTPPLAARMLGGWQQHRGGCSAPGVSPAPLARLTFPSAFSARSPATRTPALPGIFPPAARRPPYLF